MNIESLSRLGLYLSTYVILLVIALKVGDGIKYMEIVIFTILTLLLVTWSLKLNKIETDLFHKETIVVMTIIFFLTTLYFAVDASIISVPQQKLD